MAQAVSLSTTTSPMLSPKAGYSAETRNKTTAPCMASFPLRRQLPKLGLGRVRAQAQASGDNKDNSVEVQHVNKGDQGHGSAVERKPRRGSMDMISPFGEFSSLFSSTPRILATHFLIPNLKFMIPIRSCARVSCHICLMKNKSLMCDSSIFHFNIDQCNFFIVALLDTYILNF